MRFRRVLLVVASATTAAGACGYDGNDETAAGTVTVTVVGVEDSVGHDLAAVMFDGLGISNPDDRGLGGFGVKVDADPFSTIQTIAAAEAMDIDRQFPFVSDEPLVVEPGQYTITIWIAEELGPYSRWVPADSPGLGGCRIDVAVEEGQPTNVTVEGIPPWTGAARQCNTPVVEESAVAAATASVDVDPDADGTPLAWAIDLDDWGAGVHTIHMIVDFGEWPATSVDEMSGRLIWPETEVALCGVNVRLETEEGRLGVGDIFQTIEGCGETPTAMQDAFDRFGLPETACVDARLGGSDHEFCASLPITQPVDSSPQ